MSPRICATSSALASLDASLQISSRLAAHATRSFSLTCRNEGITKNRFDMIRWLDSKAKRSFVEGKNSYLGPKEDQPFPSNPLFRSQPVLSNAMKQQIYDKVMRDGMAMKAVSEEMQVDVRRVAAVVRLKEVENQWTLEGKKMATPYAKAVMSMLPKSYYEAGGINTPHEPINDIPVHNLSMQQLFVPVSESRHFTREDAAKAFHETLLSADARSPQRELIEIERQAAAEDGDRVESIRKFRREAQEAEEKYAKKLMKQGREEKKLVTKHDTERFQFRIKKFNSDTVGKDGKARNVIGWRYGAPLQDRKRGMVKIPTSVP